MAKLTKEEFIAAIKEMTVVEVVDLVHAIEEEFGFEFEDEEMYSISTVEDLKNLIEKKM